MTATAPLRAPLGLREAIHRSFLPIALLDLDDMRLLEANAAARAAIGLGDRDPLPATLTELLEPDAHEQSRQALAVLASGAVLAFESHRRLRCSDGSTFDAHLWVRSLRPMDLHAALVIFSEFEGDDLGDIATAAPGARLDLGGAVAVGSLDLELRILSCSADIVELLDEEPEDLIGSSLSGRVHPDDAATLLLGIGRAVADEHGSAMHVRLRTRDGAHVGIRLVVNPIRGTTLARLGFVMTAETPDRADDGRVADLERHLWRIALEVESAGVSHGVRRVPAASTVRGLDELSPRQWEIVTRLLRGDRVPEIARSLFLSQSTVRNQLGAVYRKLGVHSQTELLALLRGRETEPDDA